MPTTTSAHGTLQGVPEILTHEEKEEARIEAVRVECASEEASLKRVEAEEITKADQEERARARDELQEFKDSEMTKILKAGEAERESELGRIETQAKKQLPAVAASLVKQVESGVLTRS